LPLTRAIVCPPSETFSSGLTTSSLGIPDLKLALVQHRRYCEVLESCGLHLTHLKPDSRFPDSTFVEDSAVFSRTFAVIARPGAQSRRGEVDAIQEVVSRFSKVVYRINAPGTLDGGDVCEAGDTWFIGISERTNEEGAKQLETFLRQDGCSSVLIDIRERPGLLHLKTGMSWIGGNRLVVVDELFDAPFPVGYEKIRVSPDEAYAANCIPVNNHLLIPSGYPILNETFVKLGYHTISLDMSEFQKMDGGLSCLSLRFGTYSR